ncbi:MAG TPA: efflux RND transporter periplasmic adaptor subunit [Gemmatimonadaceae bacterium]|nr:efflux RND transporter periplasmic adaptor subunit [Gemmatimonadaceae bacterium]
MSRVRPLIYSSLTLAIATAALTGCRGENEASAEENTTPVVDVGIENMAVVEQTMLRVGPLLSGSLEPAREADVRAEVSGAVVQSLADNGQVVQKGQLLARIDDTAIRDQWLSARSLVTSAQNAANIARRDEERAQRLSEAGAIAERELDAARQARVAAEANLDDARARLSLAQRQVDNTQVRAPFAGLVSERAASAGDVVQPGSEMFTIVDPSSMRLEASVPAEALSALRVGDPVEFSVNAYPDRTFTGRVERINPTADPTTRQVRIHVGIPNTGGRLVAGLFAEGRVATDARNAAVAPRNAIDVRGIRPVALRVKNGRAERVEVELGLEDEATERVEIRSGLAAGDTVLVGAALGVSPGSQVRIRKVDDKS